MKGTTTLIEPDPLEAEAEAVVAVGAGVDAGVSMKEARVMETMGGLGLSAIPVTSQDISRTTAPPANKECEDLDPRDEVAHETLSTHHTTLEDDPSPDPDNYLLHSLTDQCPQEDQQWFEQLRTSQDQIIAAGFTRQSSIHNRGAIAFSEHILKAPPHVLEVLKRGYAPGDYYYYVDDVIFMYK